MSQLRVRVNTEPEPTFLYLHPQITSEEINNLIRERWKHINLSWSAELIEEDAETLKLKIRLSKQEQKAKDLYYENIQLRKRVRYLETRLKKLLAKEYYREARSAAEGIGRVDWTKEKPTIEQKKRAVLEVGKYEFEEKIKLENDK